MSCIAMVLINKRHNFIFMHDYCQVTSDIYIYIIDYIHKICVYCVCLLHFNNVPNIPDQFLAQQNYAPTGVFDCKSVCICWAR